MRKITDMMITDAPVVLCKELYLCSNKNIKERMIDKSIETSSVGILRMISTIDEIQPNVGRIYSASSIEIVELILGKKKDDVDCSIRNSLRGSKRSLSIYIHHAKKVLEAEEG